MPGPGAQLIYSPLVIQRRKDLWGEDAEDFVPERWMDPDRVKDLTADPFKFVPFNAGPRICPGQVCTLCICSYVGMKLHLQLSGQNFAYNEASFREYLHLNESHPAN